MKSIFDDITQDDIILAFFPCIRFEASILLSFRGQAKQMKKWDYERKMQYCIKLHKDLDRMYELVNELFIVCMRKGLKLIVENPYSEEHYLRRYWCLPCSIIDKDRRERGDYYAKPTQYWFVNCEPKNNLIWEAQNYNAIQSHGTDSVRWITGRQFGVETGITGITRKVARSMIHPQYANRFIREHILDAN